MDHQFAYGNSVISNNFVPLMKEGILKGEKSGKRKQGRRNEQGNWGEINDTGANNKVNIENDRFVVTRIEPWGFI